MRRVRLQRTNIQNLNKMFFMPIKGALQTHPTHNVSLYMLSSYRVLRPEKPSISLITPL